MFWQLVQANWQDFRYFLCDLVTELMRYMGSRGHMIFPFIDFHHDLRCLSFYLCSHVAFHDDIQYILFVWFYLQVWIFYSDTIPDPSLQLFESPVYFQRAKDNMKMIFSTILDWKLQADGYPGEVASLSKWLGHNFSKAA